MVTLPRLMATMFISKLMMHTFWNIHFLTSVSNKRGSRRRKTPVRGVSREHRSEIPGNFGGGEPRLTCLTILYHFLSCTTIYRFLLHYTELNLPFRKTKKVFKPHKKC